MRASAFRLSLTTGKQAEKYLLRYPPEEPLGRPLESQCLLLSA